MDLIAMGSDQGVGVYCLDCDREVSPATQKVKHHRTGTHKCPDSGMVRRWHLHMDDAGEWAVEQTATSNKALTGLWFPYS
jgi:hypothetical protein